MKYPSYPDYLKINISWLEEIPSHWKIKRLRFVIHSNPVKSEVSNHDEDELVSFVPMEAITEKGEMTLEIEKPISDVYSGYTFFKSNDVVLAKITPCFENGKGAIAKNLTNGIGFGTTEFHVLRALEETYYCWLYYLTVCYPFRAIGTSEMLGAGGQKRIPETFIKDFRIGIPSLNEQNQIAKFLDHKTAQIDCLIEKKKALIEKLNEKRIALITQAVTKGLNPDALMKPSCVNWLGDVPAHWEVRALKFCCDFLNNRRIPLSAEERARMARNYPYYGASGIIDEVEDYIFNEPTVLVAEDGANLLSRSTPLAFEASGKYWVNNHAHILKPKEGPFAYWSNLLSIIQFEPWITGSAQPKLTKDNLGAILLPRPPLHEQYLIDEYIQGQTKKIDPMLKTAKTTIERLTEYRTALITAAVTGKIDVRHIKIAEEK